MTLNIGLRVAVTKKLSDFGMVMNILVVHQRHYNYVIAIIATDAGSVVSVPIEDLRVADRTLVLVRKGEYGDEHLMTTGVDAHEVDSLFQRYIDYTCYEFESRGDTPTLEVSLLDKYGAIVGPPQDFHDRLDLARSKITQEKAAIRARYEARTGRSIF